MKKNMVVWAMLVLVLAFGMTAVGCDNEPDNSSKKNPPIFPAASGKLTINGLNSFNDKYVYVQGLVGGSVLAGLTDITGYPSDIGYKLVKISGGKAEVPLYMANPSASSYSNSYVAYSGNDTISSVSITILNESSLKASNVSSAINSNLGRKTITSGTFLNGNMTVDWKAISGTWTPSGVSPIQLTENQWADGTISTSSKEQWFTFTATASTQYIHIVFGTLTNLYVQLYDSDGDTVGRSYTELYDSTRSTSRSVISGQKYYIKVSLRSGYGSYMIAFNASNASPSWTPSGGSPTQLTENQWTDGNISTSGGEQWFTFTATASTQYIHVAFGTLTGLYVQIYDSSGNTVGNSTNLDSSTRSTSKSVTSGQKYYIKVWPYSSSRSGSYQITFNTSSASPSWTPNSSLIQLTLNQWTDGTISTSGGEQWFTFTATASTQYIHVSFGTLKDLYVQLYDSSGNTVGTSTNLDGSTRYISRSVTSGQKYYIKVWPYSGNGSYRIAFNTSNSTPSSGSNGSGSSGTWTPGGSPTQLIENQWASGTISTSSGEQWFTFTATASTQYIHVSFGTLTDLYVQLYDSNGNTVGSNTNLYSSNRSTSRSVTSGQKYYIKVWPYSGNGSYQIAFNTSSSTPSSGSSSDGGIGGSGTHTHIYGSWTYLATTALGTVIYTRSCTICGYVDTRYE